LAYQNGNLLINKFPIVADGEINLTSTIIGKISCLNTFYAQGWNEGTAHSYGEVLGWGTSACTAPTEIKALEIKEKKYIESGRVPTPITVFASAEMPLEKMNREAIVCKLETEHELKQCPNSEERTTEQVRSKYSRALTTLPWKVELTRGTVRSEKVIFEKIGLHEFGETGTAKAQSTKCFVKEGEAPANYEKLPSGCIGVNIIFPQIPAEFVFYGSLEIESVNGVGNGLDPTHLEFIESGNLFSSEGLAGEGATTGKVNLSGAEGIQLMTAK
jgi:hypothetical protein